MDRLVFQVNNPAICFEQGYIHLQSPGYGKKMAQVAVVEAYKANACCGGHTGSS